MKDNHDEFLSGHTTHIFVLIFIEKKGFWSVAYFEWAF